MKRNRSPQQRGRDYEKQLAEELGGKTIALSGAGVKKEDIETVDELIQVKWTLSESKSVKLEELKELELNAAMRGLKPVFHISFNGQDYVILRSKDYYVK